MSEHQVGTLQEWGATDLQIEQLLAGAHWFEHVGGTPVDSYWKTDGLSAKDEFYLVADSVFTLALETRDHRREDRLLSFMVAYMFHLKLNAQDVLAIDILVEKACYADAFAVCRALHSRACLLILFSLCPELFDEWLRFPSFERYRDSSIRRELESHGIYTMAHFYKLASEVIHGHFIAHGNIGYFESGVFTRIPAIENQLFVIAKFTLAMVGFAMIQSVAHAEISDHTRVRIQSIEELYSKFFEWVLNPGRLDHLYTMVGEERHWRRVGKDQVRLGGSFDFEVYAAQMSEFHRPPGERKALGPDYQLRETR
jgi:hypothetical protein